MDFGEALAALKNGKRVTRTGWNGPGQWLVLVPGSTFTAEAGRAMGAAAPNLVGQQVRYRPHIDLRAVDGSLGPWVASPSDTLADDWAEAID